MIQPEALRERLDPWWPADGAGAAALVLMIVAIPLKGTLPDAVIVGLAATATIMVVSPRIRRHPVPWLAIGGIHAAMLLRDWYRLDNHDFLIMWSLFALAIALMHEDPEEAFGTQARWLVGLVFGLATIYKLATGEFLDGDFFVHAQLVDPRFGRVAELASGLEPSVGAAARDAIGEAVRAIPEATAVTIPAGDVRPLALVMAWYGVLLEGGIAVAMLAPDRGRWPAVRSFLLLAFMATTYLVIPVIRFGLTLAALGAVQARGRWRAAFLWTVPALVAWGPVWAVIFR